MHPWELDLYTFSDLLTKVQGFSDAKKEKLKIARRMAWASFMAWAPKNMSEVEWWRIDEPEEDRNFTREDALALRQKFIDAGHLHPIKKN